MGYFLVISGQARRYCLDRDGAVLVIGRTPDNDVVIDDDRVSRHHARVEMRGEQPYVVDLGSSNGTFVNGRLCSECELSPRHEIQVGQHVLTLQSADDPSAARPDAPTRIVPHVGQAEPDVPRGWPEEMLAAMQQAQEAIERGVTANDRHATEEACGRLRQIGQDMQRLADNVRYNAGLVQMDYAACDVNELVEQAARSAGPHGIELDLDDALPQIAAHAPGLTRAVDNVVHAVAAAARQTPGRLCVTTTDRPQTRAVEIKVEIRGGNETTAASPTAVRSPAVASGHTLTDFGLVVAQAILEHHGGWVAVAPRAAANTYFLMSLPYEAEPTARSASATILRDT